MNQIIVRYRHPVVYLLVLAIIGVMACNSLMPSPKIQLPDVANALKNGEVRRLTVRGDIITVTYKHGGSATAELNNKQNVSFEETMRTFGVTPEQLTAARITYENPPLN